MSINSYTAVQGWADDQKWTDSVMDAFVDNLETWIANNVVALCPDKTSIENISGNWTFSGNTVHSGTQLFSGTGTWSGLNNFSGATTFSNTLSIIGNITSSGANTWSGGNTFSAGNTFSGANTFSATNIFSADQRINDGIAFVDSNGNEYLQFEETASAVNEFSIINAATGNAPELAATGGDTNIDIKLSPKGTGVVKSGTATLLREDGINTKIYTGGNISIGVASDAGSYVDVDATNAALTFTVNYPGKYEIHCKAPIEIILTAANYSDRVYYRLTDGTNHSNPVIERFSATGGAAGDSWEFSLDITWIATFATSGSKTIKLQKLRDANTNISTRTLLSNNTFTRALYISTKRVAD